MLYPTSWKKITVDQSKVLKNRLYRLFRFWGATRYKALIKRAIDASRKGARRDARNLRT